jgi:anti-sigma28 factor (negative regulator of flagellin synthesis)
MLKDRDFSDQAVIALKEAIKDVPVGVRAVHNQKIADDIIGRRDELKPYTSLVHSAEKQLGALSIDGHGVISSVLIHPDAKALIESLDPKSAIDQAKVEAVAKIYELALGVQEKYATPSNSLGSWQIMAFKMLSENDFSAEKIEALKKSMRNVDLGERPLETERLRSVM